MPIPTVTPHPFKSEIKKAHLRLWQIQLAIGVSDSYLSRMLNGIKPMPEEVESKIREILAEIEKPIAATK